MVFTLVKRRSIIYIMDCENLTLGRDRSPINDITPEQDIYSFNAETPRELNLLCKNARCDLCNVNLLVNAADKHYNGRLHAKSVRGWHLMLQQNSNGYDASLFCTVCNKPFSSAVVANSHYVGRKHQKAIKKQQQQLQKNADPDEDGRFGIGQKFKPPPTFSPIPVSSPAKEFRCDICVIFCMDANALQDHYAGAKHKRKLRASEGLEKLIKPNIVNDNEKHLIEQIAQVNLNCCQQTFPDIITLVDHLRKAHVQHENNPAINSSGKTSTT